MLRTYTVDGHGQIRGDVTFTNVVGSCSEKAQCIATLGKPLLEYVKDAVQGLKARSSGSSGDQGARSDEGAANPEKGASEIQHDVNTLPDLPHTTPMQNRQEASPGFMHLPSAYEVDMSAAAVLQESPAAEGGSEFQYHFTPTQRSGPSPGYLRELCYVRPPSLPPIPEEAPVQPLANNESAAAGPLDTPASGEPDSQREADGAVDESSAWDAGPHPPTPLPGMFNLASGRAVEISNACQAQARQVLGDILSSPPVAEPAAASAQIEANPPSDVEQSTQAAVPTEQPQEAPSGFFSFASGRNVAVSSEARQRAAALFADLEEINVEVLPVQDPAPAHDAPASTTLEHSKKRPVEGGSCSPGSKRGRPGVDVEYETLLLDQQHQADAREQSGTAAGVATAPGAGGGICSAAQLFAGDSRQLPQDSGRAPVQTPGLQLQMASGKGVDISSGKLAKFAAWFADEPSPAKTPADSAATRPDSAHERTPAPAAGPVAPLLQAPKQQAQGTRQPGRLPLSRLGGGGAKAGGSAFKTPRLRFETPVLKTSSRLAETGDSSRVTTASHFQSTRPERRQEQLPALSQGLLRDLLAEISSDGNPDMQRLRSGPSSPEHLFSLQLQPGEEGGPCIQPHAGRMLQALLAAGAPARLVSEAWVANSLRWVLWKLASLASRFPAKASQLLSHAVVLDELERRYDWELRGGNQPILKRVLERDEPPGRLMVLCVAAVAPAEPSNTDVHLELTDGWYAVRAAVDSGLSELVSCGRIQPGDKLRIAGAQISPGQPAPALEAAASTWLRIHFNGTHRIGPAAKLGACRHRTTVVPLHLLQPGGGQVGRTLVMLQRVYPLRFWCRGPDGSCAVRTPRAHAGALAQAQTVASAIEEHVSGWVREEEVARCKADLRGDSTPRGERAYAAAVLAGDSDMLNSRDLERHAAARRAAMESLKAERMAAEMRCAGLEEVPARGCRNLLVSAVLHEDLPAHPGAEHTEALVRLWGAPEELDGLTEGKIYSVTNLNASARRGRLELHTTTATRWQEHAAAEHSKLHASFRPRNLATLASMPGMPLGSSFDFQGILLGASELQFGDYQSSQWVFLCDASVAEEEDWLLAVQLRAGPQALDFLNPSVDANNVVSLKDVTVQGRDAANCLWQASGDENCNVSLEKLAARQIDGPARELGVWAAQHAELLESVRGRIRRLLEGRAD